MKHERRRIGNGTNEIWTESDGSCEGRQNLDTDQPEQTGQTEQPFETKEGMEVEQQPGTEVVVVKQGELIDPNYQLGMGGI